MKNLKFLLMFIAVLFMAYFTNAEEEKQVFVVVEDMPEYPGGQDAFRKDLMNEVKYPEVAKKNGIQGKVYVTFVVNTEGKVENPKIARGVDPALDKEALRAVQQLKTWKPGKQKGTLVNVQYTAPIVFTLDNKTNSEAKKKVSSDDDEQVFLIVEDMPEFPGGQEAMKNFIAENLKYPVDAQKEKIQGKVYVSFVVKKDGTVGQCKIERGVHPSLDKESIRVIESLPTWTPGKQRGKAVNVKYTVPINFALK